MAVLHASGALAQQPHQPVKVQWQQAAVDSASKGSQADLSPCVQEHGGWSRGMHNYHSNMHVRCILCMFAPPSAIYMRDCLAQGRHLPWMSSGRSQYFWMTHVALLAAGRWPMSPAALAVQASPLCALASAPWPPSAAHVASSAERAHTC